MNAIRSLRTPRAAGIAGVLFAVLLAMVLVLLRLEATSRLEDARALITKPRVALALNLVPFTGIAFLWFIGVIRDRIGEREDRFLATISLGSGLLFVALLFVASGVATGVPAAAAAAGPGAPTEVWILGQKIAAVLMHIYAMRMAAMFMFSTSTIGLRTGLIPLWIGFSGYGIGLILLLGINVTLWVELLFPLWILVLSLDVLVENFRKPPREHSQQPWELMREREQRKSA